MRKKTAITEKHVCHRAVYKADKTMVEGLAGNNVRERNRWRGRKKQTKDQRGTDGGEEEHVYADEGVIVSASPLINLSSFTGDTAGPC